MEYQVTVRYGAPKMKYHIARCRGDDLRAALLRAVDGFPDEVVESATLLEIRPAVDPDEREYFDEEAG